jgi:hypothetical protein
MAPPKGGSRVVHTPSFLASWCVVSTIPVASAWVALAFIACERDLIHLQ